MFAEMQRRAREDGVELSETDVAEWYAELRDAKLLQFIDWDAKGEPQFALTPTASKCSARNAPRLQRLSRSSSLASGCWNVASAKLCGLPTRRAFEGFVEASQDIL